MGSGSPYVLGIDGLPLGSSAVAASDGRVHAVFSVERATEHAAGLVSRVEEAVRRAEAELGLLPVEVRIVCIDDGADGTEMAVIGEWLSSQGVGFRVLDLVGPEDPIVATGSDLEVQQVRSRARAGEAALW